MTIQQFEKETKYTKDILIHKVSNMCGNYSIQFYDSNLKKWKVISFKTYQDALTFVYVVGFQKIQFESMKKIILKRGN